MAAVGGDARVDLLGEDLQDPLSDVAFEVGGRSARRRDGRARAVGVDDEEGAEAQVSLEIDGGAAQLLDAIGGDDDRQAVVVLDDVVGSGVLEEREGRGALVTAARDPITSILSARRSGLGCPARTRRTFPGQVGDPDDRPAAGDVIGGHLIDPGSNAHLSRGDSQLGYRVSCLLLLLPTAAYRAKDFLDAAAALGAEVVVASERRQALAGVMEDRALRVNLRRPEAAARPSSPSPSGRPSTPSWQSTIKVSSSPRSPPSALASRTTRPRRWRQRGTRRPCAGRSRPPTFPSPSTGSRARERTSPSSPPRSALPASLSRLALGEPWRHPRRRPARRRRGRHADPGDPARGWGGPGGAAARRVLPPRCRGRCRGPASGRRPRGPGGLRQARSPRGSLLRGDDLRHPLAPAG